MSFATILLAWGSITQLVLAPFASVVILACFVLWFVLFLDGTAWYYVWTAVFGVAGSDSMNLATDVRTMRFVLSDPSPASGSA